MTMAEPDGPKEPNFLRGGGATGALIARYDWASTPLGSIDTWPQSLKTATSIILQSPMPMALLWGDDGVLLYNDGYAKISGGRHPHLLGGKVREAWPEIAEFDDHVMKAVLGGATLEYRDQMFLLQGTDKLQRAWFNLDYSPVPDESGRIAGVLAVVVETTGRVLAERKAAAQASRERRMFEQAPGFIAILSGPDHVYEFRNETHKRLFGDENIIGRSRKELSTPYAATGLAELDPHVHQARRQAMAAAIDDTRAGGIGAGARADRCDPSVDDEEVTLLVEPRGGIEEARVLEERARGHGVISPAACCRARGSALRGTPSAPRHPSPPADGSGCGRCRRRPRCRSRRRGSWGRDA